LTFDWTESAADGTFELHGLGGGEWSVLKLGPRTERRESLAPEIAFAVLRPGAIARVDFHARQPRQVLRGIVRDAAGKVVGGRNVMVAPIAKAGPPPDGEWTSALSAADGSYEIPDLEPGTYELFVSGRLPSEVVRVERFEVAAGRASTHDVVLPLGAISGVVRDGEKHEPLDFAVLVLLRRLDNGDMDFVGKVFSDASGRYELPNLAAGVYTVCAFSTSGNLGQERLEPITVAEGARVEHVDFELLRGVSIDVRVVDENGRPIDGATIVLHDAHGLEVQIAQTQRTDADGRFRSDGIKPGHWSVRASAPGFATSEHAADLVAGERATVELTLARGGERH
jgi:5-hydroxyisourate hydrolase-like protein (transthyretin family)